MPKTVVYLLAAFVLAFGGCASKDKTPVQNCGRYRYVAEAALACPLCGEKPIVRKCQADVEDRPGLKPPGELEPPYFLYSIGCCNRKCMVESSMRYKYWREKDAVDAWNKRVAPWGR